MLENLTGEIKYLISDWYRYMDTTVPANVNRKLFTHLKYSNKARIKQLQEKHPNMNLVLLENVALRDFLKKSDEELIQILEKYGDTL